MTYIVHESSGIEYQPPRQLALALTKQYPTLLVDQPAPWRHWSAVRLAARCRDTGDGLRIYSPHQLPRRWQLYRLTDPLNAYLWRREIAALTHNAGSRVVIFDRPAQYERVHLLHEQGSAYYAHCDYTLDIIGRHDARIAEAEREMLRVVDVVFAASDILVKRFSRDAKQVIHLPCFYNDDLFDGRRPYPPPAALADIPEPRILFSGFLSGRVDFAGLLRTARARPDWHLVLVGAVSAGLEDELEQTGRPRDLFAQLCACGNVHYLGQVPLAMVPPIVASCDVGLVPYCLSDFTLTSSPIKTFEYLAMGKAVVATAVPESVGVSDEVLVAEEGGPYVESIERALVGAGDPLLIDKRMAAVRGHSASTRAATVMDALCRAGA